jgi:hypothetical protein
MLKQRIPGDRLSFDAAEQVERPVSRPGTARQRRFSVQGVTAMYRPISK